jgi:hypothetical protein
MIHPYWGTLVECAQLGGDQHIGKHKQSWVQLQWCNLCGEDIRCCHECKSVIECCPCGAYHALECPWPL